MFTNITEFSENLMLKGENRTEINRRLKLKMATGGATGGADKRKATSSPEVDPPYCRLRRRGSLPDLHEISDSTISSWGEVAKKGMLNSEVMKEIVPIIIQQLQPAIEETIRVVIEKSMASAITTAVNAALCKFKLEVIDPELDRKAREIAALKIQVEEKK